jgi:hypothetical protein
VALLPVALVPALSLLRLHGALFVMYLALIEVPFAALHGLRLPVGRRGDWFSYAFPNQVGWALIALLDLGALYLAGCLVSAVWTRARAAWARRAA